MTLSLIILALCAAAFFLASEWANELRVASLRSQAALAGAVGLFVGAVIVLSKHPLGDGFPHVAAVILTGMTGLACFWFCKTHVDEGKPMGGFVAAVLGLTIFGIGFVIHFGDAPTPRQNPEMEASQSTDIGFQLNRLTGQKRELESRLLQGIPEFRRKLRGDVEEVKRELNAATAGVKLRLDDELKEIARLLLALEDEERQTQDLISRLKQEERRLERLRETQTNLADGDDLRKELDAVWAQAGARLQKPLDAKLGSGAIADALVQQKMAEILKN